MHLSAAQIGRTARWAARLALASWVQGPEEILIGGQAVIEGVMMRSPHSYAVAVRRPSGDVAVTRGSLERASERHPWLRYPLLRGLGVLGQAMAGIAATADDVCITRGSQMGLALLARTLLRTGDVIAVEELSYRPAIEVFRLQGAKVVAFPTPAPPFSDGVDCVIVVGS